MHLSLAVDLSSYADQYAVTGRFACARAIVESYPYDMISKEKTYHILGRSVSIANDDRSRLREAEDTALWDLMHRQSRAYYQMEQLVHAFEAFVQFREEEITYRGMVPMPSSVPTSLKHAFENVEATMAPLLQPNFLLYPDEAKSDDDTFIAIRNLYLPEAIIAFNTILHSASYLITRDSLFGSMELSVAVAKEENQLTGPLVQAGRMRELMKSFALTSKAMLVLRNLGQKKWRVRRDREGRDPGMWEIGPQLRHGEEADGSTEDMEE